MISRRISRIGWVVVASVATALAGDAKRFPPTGTLVDVGGRRLHIDCQGQGSPAIIFERGAGGSSADYADLHRPLASITTACFYDRAGLGWSDPVDRIPQGSTVVEDLHQVLGAYGVRPLFVLVGHSYGGYAIRLYQARYPDDVLALGFIESAHPDQWRDLPVEVTGFIARAAAQLQWAPLLARLGLVRLMQGAPKSASEAVSRRPAALRAVRGELLAASILAEEVSRLPRLGSDFPIAVVTAGRSFQAFAGFLAGMLAFAVPAWRNLAPIPGVTLNPAISVLVPLVRRAPDGGAGRPPQSDTRLRRTRRGNEQRHRILWLRVHLGGLRCAPDRPGRRRPSSSTIGSWERLIQASDFMVAPTPNALCSSGRQVHVAPPQRRGRTGDRRLPAVAPPVGSEIPPNRLNALGAVLSLQAPLFEEHAPLTEPVVSPPAGSTAADGAYVASFTCEVSKLRHYQRDLLTPPPRKAPYPVYSP